jgi:hypothetical protein
LYKDIEWIGSDFSDKTVNNIISTSSFLIEQIVIMYVSWFVWWLLVKWLTTMKLATIWVNSSRLWKFCIYGWRVWLEWAWFYGTYTWVNWIVNEKELKEIFLNYNFYDLAKTIIFLWILRSLPLEKLKQKCNIENNRFLNEIKDITLDTWAVFGTDITIKWVESLVQQGGINFEWNIWEFLVEEISFIIPLVIWLRQADKAVNRLFDWWKKPEITANLGKDEVTITFTKWWEGEIRRSIGRLKQHRNILRNKWKSVKNINKEIAGKKKELKEVRNWENTQQEKSWDNWLEMRPIQPKDTKTESQKDWKWNNENKAKENVDSNARMEKMTWQIIEDVLKWNVEDVMRGFKESGVILPKFRELINKWELEQVKELIWGEIDLEVRRLQGEWVKVTDEWRKFVEEFKEKRVVEFERLTEIRKDGKEIQGEVKMNFKWNEWILKLKNVKEMEEYFEKLAKKLEENNRSKPNNLIIKK